MAWQATWVAMRMVAGAWLLWRIRTPRPPAGGQRPPLAIVIPARDEERSLPALLASLVPQLRDGDELVVVDDASTDATAALAAAGGADVLPAPPPPQGWAGKPWACATGAAATTNGLLVFLDADVTVLPGGLDAVVGAHEGGLLSVQPYHCTEQLYERLSAFFNVVSMMGSGAFTPRGRTRAAFGPCLVTARQEYDALGGHAAVASSALEDVALARRFRAAHRPVTCLGGRGAITFRMYPAGLGQLVEGWTKNIAAGAGTVEPLLALLVAAWLSLCIQSLVWLGTEPLLGAITYVLVALELGWMLRRVGRFGALTALLFPIPLVGFLAIFLRSAFRTLVRRQVRWKGRDVSPQV